MVSAYFILGTEDISVPLNIREEVFVAEQGFSKELERDDMDRRALHAIALSDDIPCATGRLFYGDDGFWHIGRMAVLKDYRRLGFGDLVMRMLLSKAVDISAPEVRLGAQEHAAGFYKKYGFEPCGERFFEEGCPHIPMSASLSAIERVFDGCASCGGCEGCKRKTNINNNGGGTDV